MGHGGRRARALLLLDDLQIGLCHDVHLLHLHLLHHVLLWLPRCSGGAAATVGMGGMGKERGIAALEPCELSRGNCKDGAFIFVDDGSSATDESNDRGGQAARTSRFRGHLRYWSVTEPIHDAQGCRRRGDASIAEALLLSGQRCSCLHRSHILRAALASLTALAMRCPLHRRRSCRIQRRPMRSSSRTHGNAPPQCGE